MVRDPDQSRPTSNASPVLPLDKSSKQISLSAGNSQLRRSKDFLVGKKGFRGNKVISKHEPTSHLRGWEGRYGIPFR